ncbi:MAG: hypothetical protein IPL46_00300 [Saprospiraceae bacterium]|nr:hypothetical protein [Saprospiraceae bacterium]
MNLKQAISEYTLDRYLKKKFFNFDRNAHDAKGIGIIFAADSLVHQQLAIKFSDQIKYSTQENIYLFGYVHKRLESQVTFGFPHFSLTDVRIRPDFAKHRLAIFMQRKYRVLINLDSENYKILHYVVDKTQAQFKFALNPSYPALYNIIVQRDSGDDLSLLIEKTLDIFKKTVG